MSFYPSVSQDATLSGIARDGGVDSRLERCDVTSSSTPDHQKSHTGSFIFTCCICSAGLDPSSRTMKISTVNQKFAQTGRMLHRNKLLSMVPMYHDISSGQALLPDVGTGGGALPTKGPK